MKMKIKLSYESLWLLHQLTRTVLEQMAYDYQDGLFLAVVEEIHMLTYRKLWEVRRLYKLSLSAAQAITLRMLIHMIPSPKTITYEYAELQTIADQIHQKICSHAHTRAHAAR
ncbi:MAG: hypothetical protein IRZ03_14450 [Acidobacterium ailaaui]|nr:hypothetical protein [Pseudacidobacterium ailaaui]